MATAVLGFLVGALVGMTGIGGGAIMTPLLIFGLGVAPVTAVGTDVLYAAITKIVGAWEHDRHNTVDRKLAWFLALGSVPASFLGVHTLVLLQSHYGDFSNEVLQRGLGIVLLLVGASLIVRVFYRPKHEEVRFLPHTPKSIAGTIVLGSAIGFILGLTSVGAGSLLAVALILFYRLDPHRLIGTDIFHAMILATSAGLAHLWAGHVDGVLLSNLLVGSVPGVILGSRVAARAPAQLLRPMLAILLLFTGIRLV